MFFIALRPLTNYFVKPPHYFIVGNREVTVRGLQRYRIVVSEFCVVYRNICYSSLSPPPRNDYRGVRDLPAWLRSSKPIIPWEVRRRKPNKSSTKRVHITYCGKTLNFQCHHAEFWASIGRFKKCVWLCLKECLCLVKLKEKVS